jgi:hypothetical protein
MAMTLRDWCVAHPTFITSMIVLVAFIVSWYPYHWVYMFRPLMILILFLYGPYACLKFLEYLGTSWQTRSRR